MSNIRDWPWRKVRAELMLKGISLADLSRGLGMKPKSVAKAKTIPFPKAQRAIADALGLEPWEIWPSRYHASGRPVTPTVWMLKSSTRGGTGHRQKSKAA